MGKRQVMCLTCLLLLLSNMAIADPDNLSFVPLLLGNKKIARSSVKEGVEVVNTENISQIKGVTFDGSDNTQLQISGELGTTLKNGSILFVTGGADSRFPFGFTGRVVSIAPAPSSGLSSPTSTLNTLTFEPVPFSEVFYASTYKLNDIELDADNLVDVIMPAAVRESTSASSLLSGLASTQTVSYKSFRNGAVVVRPKNTSLPSSLSGQTSTVDAGTVSLNMEVDLADLLGDETSGKFVISGEMDNIRITDNTEFELPDGLQRLYLRLDSEIEFDVNFSGAVDVSFGPFSEAWEEVEQLKMELLGQKAILKGLNTDHKFGKFPLAGLVWSIPCPNTCPVVAGNTGTSVDQAKAFGVIVWLYLNLQGDFSIDGSISIARLEPADLSISITKFPDSKLDFKRSLTPRDPSGRLLVAPSIAADVNFSLTGGITTDLDLFAGGLYIANAGIDLAAKTSLGFDGTVNYGTNSLDGPWNWQGSGCFSYVGGAGAIVRGAAAFGVEIDSAWDRFDVDEYYTYGFQLPTAEQIDNGESAGAWFTLASGEICAGICSSANLEYCFTPSGCSDAGGEWINDQCKVSTESCSAKSLQLCYTQSECEAIGGYWYNGQCNSSPPQPPPSNLMLDNFEDDTYGSFNGVTFSTDGYIGKGAYFNGANDYISYSSSFFPQQGTFEAYIKLTGDNPAWKDAIFDSNARGAYAGINIYHIAFYINEDKTLMLRLWGYDSSFNTASWSINTLKKLEIDRWYSVGASWGNQGMHIYIDGRSEASEQNYTSAWNGQETVYIGNCPDDDWAGSAYRNSFYGFIDMVRTSSSQIDFTYNLP